MSDDLKFICVCVIAIFLLFAGANHMALIACENQANEMGLKYKYGVTLGCFVETDKGWMSIDSVRYLK